MKIIFIALIVCLSSCGKSQDMQKYLSDTRAMIKKGDYKESLNRLIWFHDHALEYNKGMTGVRLSFALSDWKSLGKVYKPATDSLIAIRDRKTARLLNDGAPTDLFPDISAINRTLGQNQKTIELFEILSKKQPKGIKKFWIYSKNDLFAAKRYDIIRQYIGNPVREFSMLVEMYNINTTLYKNPRVGKAHFIAYNENNFVEKSIQLIQFALAVGDKRSAVEIQQKAMKVVQDYRLRDAIAKR